VKQRVFGAGSEADDDPHILALENVGRKMGAMKGVPPSFLSSPPKPEKTMRSCVEEPKIAVRGEGKQPKKKKKAQPRE